MIQRILVALDGSSRAQRVVQTAVEITRPCGATLIPFRAIHVPAEFTTASRRSKTDLLPSHLKELATCEILALLGDSDVAWELPVVEHGQPWYAILEAAEREQADLIVIGSRGYHGFDRALGTTAEKVANLARRCVLIVHEAQV